MIIQVTMNNYNTTSSLQNEHKNPTESLLRSREKNSPSFLCPATFLHPLNLLILECSILLNLHHMLLFTCTGLFWGCCTGDRQTLENMPALWKHSRRLMKAASAWFPHPTLGIYIPVPARGKNKLLHTVTDATGHTTGRSLQAIYQKKRVLNSTPKVWMRKQVSLNRKLLTNWKASGQALKKVSGSEGGSGSPSR